MSRRVLALLTAILLVGPLGHTQQETITRAPAFTPEMLTALPTTGWLTNGGNIYNQRYSELDEINRETVDSGQILWRYTATLDPDISTVCCGWTSRGVGLGDGKVFVGQLDGKLVALDQHVYILDRTNGEPLIGIEERRVPQEPRQATAATQPYPIGDAFVPQSIDIAPEGYTLVNQGRIRHRTAGSALTTHRPMESASAILEA